MAGLPPFGRERLERFARLGLSGNPFRVVQRHELPDLYVAAQGPGMPTAESVWNLPEPLVELMAPRGFGKSTLLAALRQRLGHDGIAHRYHYLPVDQRNRLPSLRGVQVLLLDECQRLAPWNRQRLLWWLRRRGRRVITGTHEPWRQSAVPSRVLQLPGLTVDHLIRVYRRRMVFAGGSADDYPLEPDAAGWLIEHTDSLRAAEEILYHVFQRGDMRTGSSVDVHLVRFGYEAVAGKR